MEEHYSKALNFLILLVQTAQTVFKAFSISDFIHLYYGMRRANFILHAIINIIYTFIFTP